MARLYEDWNGWRPRPLDNTQTMVEGGVTECDRPVLSQHNPGPLLLLLVLYYCLSFVFVFIFSRSLVRIGFILLSRSSSEVNLVWLGASLLRAEGNEASVVRIAFAELP